MKIGTTQLIAENIAPSNAASLAIFNGDTKIGSVDISKMIPNELGEKLYSFGLVSDMHLDGVNVGSDSGERLSAAFTFFEKQGCSFCCHTGDMTNTGFWSKATDDGEAVFYDTQMAEFKSVLEAHPNLPVYGCCGNHESYYHSIMDNLTELKEYTGRDLCYIYTHGNDVFIFVGQPAGTIYAHGKKQEWINELQWLYETLEANRDKRCFVFEHLTLSDDSGNPNNIHNAYWLELEPTLVGIMKHYKNAMLFHGHSHLDLSEQFNFSYSNYSTKKGFKSIHVPSSAGGRKTVDGVLDKTNDKTKSGGYIVEVYKNYVLLKGYNFNSWECVPIAQYCINTSKVYVETNTFTDATGVLTK